MAHLKFSNEIKSWVGVAYHFAYGADFFVSERCLILFSGYFSWKKVCRNDYQHEKDKSQNRVGKTLVEHEGNPSFRGKERVY